MAFPRVGYHPEEANHVTPRHTVGGFYAGKTAGGHEALFRYVKFEDVATVAIAIGSVVQHDGTTFGSVTADISASLDATLGRAAGIALNTPSAGRFGFVQVKGFCTNITTDGNVAQGDFLVSGADGVADPYAISDTPLASGANADAARVFGQALAADASTTLAMADLWIA